MKFTQLLKVPVAFERVTGVRPPDGTWRRWVLAGLARRSGEGRVRLRTVKLGGGVMTTEEYVVDFIDATTNEPAQRIASESSGNAESAENYLNCELGGDS